MSVLTQNNLEEAYEALKALSRDDASELVGVPDPEYVFSWIDEMKVQHGGDFEWPQNEDEGIAMGLLIGLYLAKKADNE